MFKNILINKIAIVKSCLFISMLSLCLLVNNSFAYSRGEGQTQVKKCESNTNSYTNSNYYDSAYNNGCPCFSSAQKLRNAIGDASIPTGCNLNKSHAVLTGGPIEFTSLNSGDVYNCYFENRIEPSKIKQVVERGSKQEVLNMHMACLSVIRDFARDNRLSCIK